MRVSTTIAIDFYTETNVFSIKQFGKVPTLTLTENDVATFQSKVFSLSDYSDFSCT